ncbi:MAG: signal peptidase II [SAR202 cluster bacterium]|nr:signal peptidase II [SAR202 cluster bacterium]|tara:strand:+ start:4280 stop:4762 length:483 start_codon:yes stop_codon:yes gene_type:complete
MIWYKDKLFYFISIVVIFFDQFTKYLIKEFVPRYSVWPDQGIFQIVHGVNTGSAFGLFSDYTLLLTIGSLVGIGFVLYFFYKNSFNVIWMRISLSLIVGGALGNLIDRIRDGGVVDFISVGWWPAFNIADSAISIGMGILIFTLVFGEKLGWYSTSSDED